MQGNSKTQGTSFGCGLRTTLNWNQGTSCKAGLRVQDAAPAPPAPRWSGTTAQPGLGFAFALLRRLAVPRLGRRRWGCLGDTGFLRGGSVQRETEFPRGGWDAEELRGTLRGTRHPAERRGCSPARAVLRARVELRLRSGSRAEFI